jgi:hypothetical protein
MEEALSFALATVAIPGYLAGTWKADPVHPEVAFSVRHLMVSNTRGRFTSYDVTIVTSEDPRARGLPRRSTSRPSTPETTRGTTTSAPPTISTSRSTRR